MYVNIHSCPLAPCSVSHSIFRHHIISTIISKSQQIATESKEACSSASFVYNAYIRSLQLINPPQIIQNPLILSLTRTYCKYTYYIIHILLL